MLNNLFGVHIARKISRIRFIIIKSINLIQNYGFFHFFIFCFDKLAQPDSRSTDYNRWIKKNTLGTNAADVLLESLNCDVKFSIVIPVYKPQLEVLQTTIMSVVNQAYKNWEICLAVSETNQNVIDWLNSMTSLKIKMTILDKNLGIAGNTNAAILLASGHYIAFLDHDDLLPFDSLLEVASAIEKGNPDFIYTDEDKITKDGKKRFSPCFKPSFSPDLLRSMNYICHFMVVKKELGEKVGWLRSEYDGAQDYDFTFRCTEVASKIIHIPKVLYHWRATETSSLTVTGEKNYAHDSGKKAVEDHLMRIGAVKAVVGNGFTRFRYNVQFESDSDLVSIIIPNKDQFDLLKKCIDSILIKSTYRKFEIIIIENNSTHSAIFDYYTTVEKMHPQVKVLFWKSEFNYSSINNFGAHLANGKYLLFLNNDIEVISPDWIERLLDYGHRKDVGAVGAKLLFSNNTVQHGGVILGIGEVAGHAHKFFNREDSGYMDRLQVAQNLSAVTGACLLIKKQIFLDVGGFDEKLAVAFNDVDLCLKVLKQGYLNVWTPFAELYHHESVSRGLEDTKEKLERYENELDIIKTKWKELLDDGDPYYNPNLTLLREDFSIRLGKN